MRDEKVVREFNRMDGAITARVDAIAVKHRLTVNTVYQIVRKSRKQVSQTK
jgi:Mor family transcriptional regulator